VPQNPGNEHADQGNNSATEQPSQVPQDFVQDSPSAESIVPGPTPDTHTFSSTEWLKSNPDGNPDEAKEHAQSLGYTVTD